MTELDADVNKLQAELAAVKAKLAKTEASKQKLKEHWALLKEKVINAHTLCDERDALLKQLNLEAAAKAEAQKHLQEALSLKASAEQQFKAANQEQHRLARQLNAAEAEKQRLEKQLVQAQKAATHAKQQHDASEATNQDMMQRIDQLQHAVQQLQQQQLNSRVSKLEHHWRQLLDREYILTVEPQELHTAVQPSIQQLLQQQVEPRLDSLQDNLSQLEHQIAAQQQSQLQCIALQLPEQQQRTDQTALQDVQQMLQSIITEQRSLRGALSDTQHQLAAMQKDSVVRWQPNLQDFGIATAASTRPSRETSPAAMASAAGGCIANVRVPVIATEKGLRTAAEAAAGVQVSKGSSMFGTTILDIGGLSSSHSFGDQDYNSPSEASAHFRQPIQLQQQVGRKRVHLQQQSAVQQHLASTHSAATGCSSAVATAAALHGKHERLVNRSGSPLHRQPQKPAESDENVAMSSSSDGGDGCDEDESDSQHSPKRPRVLKEEQEPQHKYDTIQQVQQPTGLQSQQPGAAASWHDSQKKLSGHLRAVREQQADAAAAAQQVAKLVLDGSMKVDDIVTAVSDSFLNVAGAHYDIYQVQQVVAVLLAEPQQLQESGLVGWVAAKHGAAKVGVYQQRLAAYVKLLSDLLQTGNMASGAGKRAVEQQERHQHQQPLDWPAAAGCWQQLLQELSGSSYDPRSVAGTSTVADGSNLLHRVLHHLLQPVHAACQTFTSAKSPHPQQPGGHAGDSVQQRQQQQLPLTRACAAVSAAARLLRCCGDSLQYQCMLLKLAWAAASAWQHCTSSEGPIDTGKALQSSDGMQYSLACLLAAVGTWPDVVQLVGWQEQAAVVAGDGMEQARDGRNIPNDLSWQLAVLDPVKLSLGSCIAALAQAATSAAGQEGPKAAGRSSSSSSCCCEVVGQALLKLLQYRLSPAVGGSTGDGSRHKSGLINADREAQAAVALGNFPEPAAVLSMLLGLLKVMLRKQHGALPAGQLVGSDVVLLAYTSSVCAAVRLCAMVVGGEQSTAMMREVSTLMVDSGTDGNVVVHTVQHTLKTILCGSEEL